MSVEESDDAALPKTVTIDIEKSFKGRLQQIGGSKADDWNELIGNQSMRTLWKSGHQETDDFRMDGVLSALICMKPKDEFEGMLMAQMIGAHNAAMECHRRAMIPEQSFIGRSEALNQANKLSRTFATLLEALNRHRGKGQQKVRVEHVHVYSGGQAVVGVVERPGEGGQGKLESQPYEQVTDAPKPTLRGPDEERTPLPVPSNAKRALQNTRRPVPGRTKGKS